MDKEPQSFQRPPEKVCPHIDSRAVAMEVGISYECVTTHRPNAGALKMEGPKIVDFLYQSGPLNGMGRVGGRRRHTEGGLVPPWSPGRCRSWC